METLKSENKKRVLPSWMTAPVNERKVVSVKTAKRKQTAARKVGAATSAGITVCHHTRPSTCVSCSNDAKPATIPIPGSLVRESRGVPATETVYCMNEAEMVDVALGILIEGRKQEKPWEQPLEATAKLQLSPPCSQSRLTSSPGSSNEEEDSRNNLPALDLSSPQGPEASDSSCSRSPEEEKEEEDALKYVREIFFS